MSDTDKLKQLEKVVRSSDEKLKPILSPEQNAKLEQMRAEQKQELEALIASASEKSNWRSEDDFLCPMKIIFDHAVVVSERELT